MYKFGIALAKVRMEVGDSGNELTVAMQEKLGYDTWLGSDFPDLWGMGKCLLYDEIANAVQTCSQTDETEYSSLLSNDKEVPTSSNLVMS